MNRAIKTGAPLETVRFADAPRIAVVEQGNTTGAGAQIDGFGTIAAHAYRGTYYPGYLPRVDYPTRCEVTRAAEMLQFDLWMSAPHMESLLESLPEDDDGAFWESDFVSLNFVHRAGHVVQVGVKPRGECAVFQGRCRLTGEGVESEVRIGDEAWTASVQVPLSLLGSEPEDFEAQPIPFDIVRYTRANGAVTSWCPIPDQLPFNEKYDFPVFCFGLLASHPLEWSEYAGATDLGAWSYDGPACITAGSFTRFNLRYTAGRHGLAEGGALRFVVQDEVLECNRKTTVSRRFPEKDWTALQWDDPGAPGYVSVTCSNPDARLELRRDLPFSISLVVAEGAALQEGDVITIGVGVDPSGPGIKAQQLTRRALPMKCFVGVTGHGIFDAPGEFPSVRITGGPAAQLQIHAPPTPDPDEPIRLLVVATDHIGNIAEGYRGRVHFFGAPAAQGLPQTYEFTAEDEGVAEFTVYMRDRGVFVIDAYDEAHPQLTGESNLIVTDRSFGPRKIYFGDIHTHSQNSDGRLPPMEKYREVALHRGLDFWSLTDHGHDLTPERLKALDDVNESCRHDHRFVTLPGYEWTTSMGQGKPLLRKQFGHRNIYFRQPLRTVFDGLDPRSDSPDKLAATLADAGWDYVAYNHFHCGDPTLYPELDSGVEVSGWCGNQVKDDVAGRRPFAYRGEPVIVRDLFAKRRLAVVAGTDHGSEAFHTGLPAELAAVRSETLTRDGVFDALRKGATYGTSGQKTLLKFTVNGVEAGDAGDAPDNGGTREVELLVGSVTPVIKVEIFRDGERWYARMAEPRPRAVSRWSLTDETATGPGHYWARVQTAQGHWAWSSPVYCRPM